MPRRGWGCCNQDPWNRPDTAGLPQLCKNGKNTHTHTHTHTHTKKKEKKKRRWDNAHVFLELKEIILTFAKRAVSDGCVRAGAWQFEEARKGGTGNKSAARKGSVHLPVAKIQKKKKKVRVTPIYWLCEQTTHNSSRNFDTWKCLCVLKRHKQSEKKCAWDSNTYKGTTPNSAALICNGREPDSINSTGLSFNWLWLRRAK